MIIPLVATLISVWVCCEIKRFDRIWDGVEKELMGPSEDTRGSSIPVAAPYIPPDPVAAPIETKALL